MPNGQYFQCIDTEANTDKKKITQNLEIHHACIIS